MTTPGLRWVDMTPEERAEVEPLIDKVLALAKDVVSVKAAVVAFGVGFTSACEAVNMEPKDALEILMKIFAGEMPSAPPRPDAKA